MSPRAPGTPGCPGIENRALSANVLFMKALVSPVLDPQVFLRRPFSHSRHLVMQICPTHRPNGGLFDEQKFVSPKNGETNFGLSKSAPIFLGVGQIYTIRLLECESGHPTNTWGSRNGETSAFRKSTFAERARFSIPGSPGIARTHTLGP